MEQYPNGLAPETWTARFHAACCANNLPQVKALVSELNGKDIKREIDKTDIDLYTPLHHSCEKGFVDIVQERVF